MNIVNIKKLKKIFRKKYGKIWKTKIENDYFLLPFEIGYK